MLTAADLELLAKHSGEPTTFRSNEAILRALPRAKQAAVISRLRALDEYLAAPEQTASDAARLAATLSMSERNFYRLVSKLRERGPVLGLAPGYRTQRRSSAASDGLGKVADVALERLLETSSDASWKDAVNEVLEACRNAGTSPPSQAAIRRRLLALRAESQHRENRGFFGEKWLMDQSAVSLRLVEGAEVRQAVATLLVDRRTRLIAGAGCVSSTSPESGVVTALEDAWSRVPLFAREELNLAVRPRDITWVVPEGMSGRGFVMSYGVSSTPSTGPRRHGERLLRLIGGKLGPFALLIRSTAEPAVLVDLIGEREAPPVDYAKALELIRHAAGKWNEGILAIYPPSDEGRSSTARGRRLRNLMSAVIDLFLPAVPSPSAARLERFKGGDA